ncbi:hypothetical protein PSN45_000134 [Yamadazyma tenuis]|uniref:P-loop containing nucleoside triphosphate hydrolase protein n=1 Tax=Candida tenuis (strain ATCC 10573 / BCRC 21748 / CBS 615 / JCM 9827 / NBRC 10315 / NRRL Y-1498 / VKM Y-70) TaxID=590646 RepID=G3BAW0_CANTC|nr:uncharacterized protein CANTEDRAFT_124163 [Yamadazyma tenuis ATCC 10573]EGV61465.1 hypothetical protein CANTEDRAFT_124163 [Yamadazyma tenuis ATCC 10573]WEJ92679.1 hypothetical protein PSN45_000134 [Yamadazyma tenuis]
MSEKHDLERQPILYQKRWFSFLMSKRVPPITGPEDRVAYDHSGILNRLFFVWVFRLLKVGYKRTIEATDLFYLPHDMKVDHLHRKFETHFAARLARSSSGETTTWMLILSLFDTFRFRYLYAVGALLLCDTGSSAMPLLSRKLIGFVQSRQLGVDSPIGKGIGYALGTSFGSFTCFLFANQYLYYSILTAAQVKAILTKFVLAKSFKADAKSKHDYPASKLTTLVATDLAKIEFGIRFAPLCLTFPMTLIVCITILAVYIGAPSAVGIGVVILFTFLLSGLSAFMVKLRKKSLVFTDERIKLIKEVVHHLKVIKFYSWEVPYYDTIVNARKQEAGKLYHLQFIRNILMAFALTVSIFASMASFLVLYTTDNQGKDAANVFSAVSLFGLLGFFITNIPLAVSTTADCVISLGRVAAFLNSKETSISANVSILPDALPSDSSKDQIVVDVQNASFCWHSFEDAPTEEPTKKTKKSNKTKTTESTATDGFILKEINIKINKGEFIIVTGVVGSGKTSFLNALAGFMTKKLGSVAVNGSLLLCSTNWVQNETIKNNILFGDLLDEKKYQQAIYSCSLNDDFEYLPAGDRTEVGERGITLSGGQKARVNLARAVYNDYDIVLLDDVLSAVDARVGKHIMESCILGTLGDKTRILATHQLSFINAADRIIFMNGDGSIDIGTVEELKEASSAFMNLVSYSYKDQTTDMKKVSADFAATEEDGNDELPVIQAKDYDSTGKLIEDERRAVSTISWDIYKQYVKLGSKPFNPLLFTIFALLGMSISAFCQLFTNTWLSFWTEQKFDKPDRFYIGIYVMFAVLALLFIITEFLCYIHVTNVGSKRLNIKAVQNLLHTPMSFLDTTPIGRILNRFTKDTDSLDNEIIEQVRLLSHSASLIVGTVVLCICYLPWFAIAIPILVTIFLFAGSYYQASSREIKRLEAVQRSFVFNNFNESLTGMEVIQAYGSEPYFIDRNDMFIDNMNEANYLVNAVQRWLAMHLNVLAFLFVLIITLLCVTQVFNISAASTGLLLSYVLIMPNLFTLIVQSYTQLENEMNSVERMCEFAFDLPQEKPYHISETAPKPSWPNQGQIKFNNVYMAYRPGLPDTLKNVNLDIRPNERIGICGRTGAGKSSIIHVLFRLGELSSGSIEIDGVDISTLGLKELRSHLSIIPQEAVLFRGTVRSNLDPFKKSSDEELWKVLIKAGILTPDECAGTKPKEQTSKFDLDAVVEDDGNNFSLGERQLIAFARALVKNSKILFLDEATSSVDYKTDSKIQNIIVEQFGDRTILCIAHRLQTILNYDRIIVMDNGEVKEFDKPWTLFQRQTSIFRSLCEKAKITANDFV